MYKCIQHKLLNNVEATIKTLNVYVIKFYFIEIFNI